MVDAWFVLRRDAVLAVAESIEDLHEQLEAAFKGLGNDAVNAEIQARLLPLFASRERAAAEKALNECAQNLPFPIDPYAGFDYESLRAAHIQHSNWLRSMATGYRGDSV